MKQINQQSAQMWPDYQMQSWQPWINKSGTTCPGFGLISLIPEPPVGGISDKRYHHEVDGNQIVLHGYQPSHHADELQDAGMIAVNSPMPVPPGERGQCTQDYPARVLIDRTPVASLKPAMLVGMTCGPIAGSWLASPLCNAYDIAHDFEARLSNVVQVHPSPCQQHVAVAVYGANATVTSGDKIIRDPVMNTANSTFGGGIPTQFLPSIDFSAAGDVVARRSALFIGDVTATIFYPGGDSGQTLLASIAINAKRVAEVSTPFAGTETIEGDRSVDDGAITNRPHTLTLSVPFALRLRAGDAIIPRYSGDVDVQLSNVYMTIRTSNTGIIQRDRS